MSVCVVSSLVFRCMGLVSGNKTTTCCAVQHADTPPPQLLLQSRVRNGDLADDKDDDDTDQHDGNALLIAR